ncbi:MAG: hypothetical protein QM648_06310 [Solirubrobacterales bacterium]
MRTLFQAAVIVITSIVLSGEQREKVLRRLFGHEVHPTARIGLCLIAVDHMKLGRDAGIGHFTLIKGLRVLDMADETDIGRFNWITGMPLSNTEFYQSVEDRDPSLEIGFGSVIIHRHIIDCTNKVTIGELSGIAGYRCTLLTHGVDIRENRQSAGPIVIGDRSIISSNCVVIGGTTFPDRSVLAAGSMVRGRNEEPGLYAGVPAKRVGDLPEDAKFFTRTTKMIY